MLLLYKDSTVQYLSAANVYLIEVSVFDYVDCIFEFQLKFLFGMNVVFGFLNI